MTAKEHVRTSVLNRPFGRVRHTAFDLIVSLSSKRQTRPLHYHVLVLRVLELLPPLSAFGMPFEKHDMQYRLLQTTLVRTKGQKFQPLALAAFTRDSRPRSTGSGVARLYLTWTRPSPIPDQPCDCSDTF